MADDTSGKILWTAVVIARYLGVSRNTLLDLIKNHGMPCAIIGGKYCAHADNLEEYFRIGTGKGMRHIPEDAE